MSKISKGCRDKLEMREVRIGSGKLSDLMTESQARRYGDSNMPKDLKAAGFKTFVFASDQEINYGIWFRISYGKDCHVR